MSSIGNDYRNFVNQTKLNNAKSLLGNAEIGGLGGDLMQQWSMLGANGAAYRKLLEAEKSGSLRQNGNYTELLSDKLVNDYYDKDTKQLIKPTYTPQTSISPAIGAEKNPGEVLGDMRTLALAAIGHPNSLNPVQFDFFEKMHQSISGNLVAGESSSADDEAETIIASGDDSRAALAAAFYDGILLTDQEFTVQGAKGAQEFSFKQGDSADLIADAINAASDATGVTAEIIRGASGRIEAIGLLADKAGSGQYVQVTQNLGDLFANAGKTVAVAGSGVSADGTGAPAIATLADLGQISLDGVAYSFADLTPGGKASLERNPDAALAVIDQALRDIYAGRAALKGFDPETAYFPGLTASNLGAKSSVNVLEINNYGSDAMREWIERFAVKES